MSEETAGFGKVIVSFLSIRLTPPDQLSFFLFIS